MGETDSKTGELSLYVILLGCKPKGRNVEQHDVMFGVGKSIDDLSEDIKSFWYKPVIAELSAAVKKNSPEVQVEPLEKTLLSTLSRRDKVHIDAWTQVLHVDGYNVTILPKSLAPKGGEEKLYFINLGGYKENEFEEYHKKLFVVATAVSEALGKIMNDDFMKEQPPENLGLAGSAHLDDQYKIDFEADDIVCVSDAIGDEYTLALEKVEIPRENKMVVGYAHINYPE